MNRKLLKIPEAIEEWLEEVPECESDSHHTMLECCNYYESGFCRVDGTNCGGRLRLESHTPTEVIAYCTDKKITTLILDYRKWTGKVGD